MSTEITIDRYSSNPSGFINRLYTQTSSSTPVAATAVERSLLDGGLGTLTIPANETRAYCARWWHCSALEFCWLLRQALLHLAELGLMNISLLSDK